MQKNAGSSKIEVSARFENAFLLKNASAQKYSHSALETWPGADHLIGASEPPATRSPELQKDVPATATM